MSRDLNRKSCMFLPVLQASSFRLDQVEFAVLVRACVKSPKRELTQVGVREDSRKKNLRKRVIISILSFRFRLYSRLPGFANLHVRYVLELVYSQDGTDHHNPPSSSFHPNQDRKRLFRWTWVPGGTPGFSFTACRQDSSQSRRSQRTSRNLIWVSLQSLFAFWDFYILLLSDTLSQPEPSRYLVECGRKLVDRTFWFSKTVRRWIPLAMTDRRMALKQKIRRTCLQRNLCENRLVEGTFEETVFVASCSLGVSSTGSSKFLGCLIYYRMTKRKFH